MTVPFLKYVPRKYKPENDSFTPRKPVHHDRHCTGQGTEAQLTWSPQAPPLLTAAVQDVSRDTSAFYWESYALV